MVFMRVLPYAALPPVAQCMERSQSLAMLDAILSPEWEYRYYSFNSFWAPAQQMASMRDGSGDHYFMLFVNDGVVAKFFDHELDDRRDDGNLSAELRQIIPVRYHAFLSETAFSVDEVSSWAWFDAERQLWLRTLSDAPEAERRIDSLTQLLTSRQPRAYVDWASEYFELDISLAAVEPIFEHEPLTEALVAALNDELSLADVMDDSREIGYPVAAT